MQGVAERALRSMRHTRRSGAAAQSRGPVPPR